MNITFLIGNGFDLNCGLKSSYNDMYKEYCKIKETDSESIKKFKNLINQNYETWGDFELAMAENIDKFETEDNFVKCLIDFKKYLVKYLSEEQTKFFKKYDNNYTRSDVHQEILLSIRNFYKDVTNNITNNIDSQISKGLNYNFISFNYTHILADIFNSFNSFIYNFKQTFINIHGSLEGNDTILGIDNEEQLKLKKFKLSNRGKISFIKPIFNNEFDSNRITKAKEAIIGSDIICVYGMSLGESDLTWKKLLIQWLDSVLSDDNKHLFIYDYKNCKKNIIFKDEQMYEEIQAKNKFITEKLKIEKTNDKLEKYFEKIHMPFKNIFNINRIVNKEEIMLKTAYQKMIDEKK